MFLKDQELSQHENEQIKKLQTKSVIDELR